MKWLDPFYLWAEVLPPLLLLVWVIAERLRRQRLRKFGDIRIMGVPLRLSRHILAVVLLALGTAATAAVLALPTEEARTEEAAGVRVEILLDARLSNIGPTPVGYSLADIEDRVREIVELAPSSSYALFRSGSPLEMVTPETSDSQGLLILMNRLSLNWQANASASLKQSLLALTMRKSSKEGQARRIVVVTTKPLEDFATLLASLQDPNLEVLFACLPTNGSRTEFVTPGAQRNWDYSEQRDTLREFLVGKSFKGLAPLRPHQYWSYLQLFAALGFFALLAESILASNTGFKAEDISV